MTEHAETPAPFELRISGTGRIVRVESSQSPLEALERAGIPLRFACRMGVCGACRTTVVAGVPLHKDYILKAEERQSGTVFMPCCSRALSPVLEIDVCGAMRD